MYVFGVVVQLTRDTVGGRPVFGDQGYLWAPPTKGSCNKVVVSAGQDLSVHSHLIGGVASQVFNQKFKYPHLPHHLRQLP